MKYCIPEKEIVLPSCSYLRTRFVYSICFVSTGRKHSMFCCLVGLRIKQGGLFWISRWARTSFLPVLLAVGTHYGLEVLVFFAEIQHELRLERKCYCHLWRSAMLMIMEALTVAVSSFSLEKTWVVSPASLLCWLWSCFPLTEANLFFC